LNWSESEKVKWKTEIPLLGLSSPIVLDNQIWLTTATEDGHGFYALCVDAVWKTDRSEVWNDEHIDKEMVRAATGARHTAPPLIFTIAGDPVMGSVGAKAVYGYDPRTGKELWRVDHPAYSAAARPVSHEGRFIIVTGFSQGAKMISVRSRLHGLIGRRGKGDLPPHAASPLPDRGGVGEQGQVLGDPGKQLNVCNRDSLSVSSSTGFGKWRRNGFEFDSSDLYPDELEIKRRVTNRVLRLAGVLNLRI